MIDRFRDRRRAESLQEGLERYDRMLANGTDPSKARAEVAAELGDDGAVFALAANLGRPQAALTEFSDAEMFAQRLRHMKVEAKPGVVGRIRNAIDLQPKLRLGFAPGAVAACIAIACAILIPSLNSLPGDSLYAIKGAAETSRVFLATGSGEARVRLELAEERFEEVSGLINREHNQALAVGVNAAGADEITDPEIARLITRTLERAQEQVQAAAIILIASPNTDRSALDELVKVSQLGQTVTEAAATQVSSIEAPPLRTTVTKLARIEAQAKAVRQLTVPAPTIPPCATPDASPSSSPEATVEPTPAVTPEPTDVPAATGETFAQVPFTPEPSVEPTATPCATPTSTEAPAATPTPIPTEPAAPTSDAPADESTGADDDSGVEGVPSADQPAA